MKRADPTQIRHIAIQVRQTYINWCNKTEGGCKEISMAIALRMAELDIPVSVCMGTVTYNGEKHYHYWNEADDLIVDATADQFGISDDVIIKDEQKLKLYNVCYTLILTPSRILKLVEESRSVSPPK